MSSAIQDRDAARVILLDEHDHVLLLRCGEPGHSRRWWIAPGGGLDPHETHEQAACRELREETGLERVELGPCVWHRTHEFDWLGQRLRQRERFFVARVTHFEPDRAHQTQDELMYLDGHRWWHVDEINRATANGESFAPRRIGCLLSDLLTAPPTQPVDVGV
ncbi:MAG: NUDIX domain-containing protein [Planctomycetota bacterium]